MRWLITDEDALLKNYFSIPEPCLTLDIESLKSLLSETDFMTCYSGLYNCLKRNDIHTIGAVLETSHFKLLMVRNLGQRRHELLYRLLQQAAECPEMLIDSTKNHPKQKVIVDKAMTYIETVIENYKTDEELAILQEKEAKLKSIKDRLRNMGMII